MEEDLYHSSYSNETFFAVATFAAIDPKGQRWRGLLREEELAKFLCFSPLVEKDASSTIDISSLEWLGCFLIAYKKYPKNFLSV
jgi:hypothetical protein